MYRTQWVLVETQLLVRIFIGNTVGFSEFAVEISCFLVVLEGEINSCMMIFYGYIVHSIVYKTH
jgi:hypothetical protein